MKSQMQINKSLQKMVSKKHLTVINVLVKCFLESDFGANSGVLTTYERQMSK